MQGLKDKAVVITGSGRGIGAACAKGAARQGAAVVVNDVDGDEAERVVRAMRRSFSSPGWTSSSRRPRASYSTST